MDFDSIRKEYESNGLEQSTFDKDPLKQFAEWYDVATEHLPGKWFEPNAMSLATADASGRVSVRYVLLKGVVEDGIRFFTNYDSDKGKQLASNANCAVAFHWPYLGRQVRIEGAVEKTTREVSKEYFHSRPRGSQIGAAVSPQSSTIELRSELEKRRDVMIEQLDESPVPLPENWGGYLVRPNRFEFWQGRRDRLHDRLIYTRETGDQNEWKIVRLAP